MKVPKDEAIRQFRARGASLIEAAAVEMERVLPEDVEVGQYLAVLLPMTVDEPDDSGGWSH